MNENPDLKEMVINAQDEELLFSYIVSLYKIRENSYLSSYIFSKEEVDVARVQRTVD